MHQSDATKYLEEGTIKMKKRMIATLVMGATIVWGSGVSANATTPYASSSLKAQLQYLVEEEKMAHDVYAALATSAVNPRYANIARAEQIHLNEVSAIMKTYGIWNPTLTRAPGVFYNKTLANLYTTLVAQGSKSATNAYAAGVTIERADIADLANIAKNVTQPDIQYLVTSLKAGSTNHLAAFQRY